MIRPVVDRWTMEKEKEKEPNSKQEGSPHLDSQSQPVAGQPETPETDQATKTDQSPSLTSSNASPGSSGTLSPAPSDDSEETVAAHFKTDDLQRTQEELDKAKKKVEELESWVKKLNKKPVKKLDFEPEVNRAQEYSNRAKIAIGTMIRKRQAEKKNEKESEDGVVVSGKFQPSQSDLETMREVDHCLCLHLKYGNLKNFCEVLWPDDKWKPPPILTRNGLDSKPWEEETESITEPCGLKEKDNLFTMAYKSAVKEFNDQMKRARVVAKALVEEWLKLKKNSKVTLLLLDGHGRMLLCILKWLLSWAFDPDDMLKIQVFETDPHVQKWHESIFPHCIECKHESILQVVPLPQEGSVVYLNFCNIPTFKEADANKPDADLNKVVKNNRRENVTYACSKEGVLRYVWKVTREARCTVVVSFAIVNKLSVDIIEGKYGGWAQPVVNAKCNKTKEGVWNQLTGVGLLQLLLLKGKMEYPGKVPVKYQKKGNKVEPQEGFRALIPSCRGDFICSKPEDGIVWHETESGRVPKRLKHSGQAGQVFASVLVSPPSKHATETNPLHEAIDELLIAERFEDLVRVRVRVRLGVRVRSLTRPI